MRHTFIPNEIQCFWCNGEMKVGTLFTGSSTNHVSYFCKRCGAVSHFAMIEKRKITAIEVEYKSDEEAAK